MREDGLAGPGRVKMLDQPDAEHRIGFHLERRRPGSLAGGTSRARQQRQAVGVGIHHVIFSRRDFGLIFSRNSYSPAKLHQLVDLCRRNGAASSPAPSGVASCQMRGRRDRP